MGNIRNFSVSREVRESIKHKKPIVALESAILCFGLPAPYNVQTALECERIVRKEGAYPATIGIIKGQLKIGLTTEEIRALARQKDVVKTNLSNLAAVLAMGKFGATTVSATVLAASRAGIKVVATGGIGGVHRHFESSKDISTDLTSLSRYQTIVVCSGAKAILDTRATVEMLETLGIPVIGFRTSCFPLFYTRESSFNVDCRVENEKDLVKIFNTHCALPGAGSILVAVPIPKPYEIPSNEIEKAMKRTRRSMIASDISGRDVTPFLLKALEKETRGVTLKANLALVRNNVRIAARIAKALVE